MDFRNGACSCGLSRSFNQQGFLAQQNCEACILDEPAPCHCCKRHYPCTCRLVHPASADTFVTSVPRSLSVRRQAGSACQRRHIRHWHAAEVERPSPGWGRQASSAAGLGKGCIARVQRGCTEGRQEKTHPNQRLCCPNQFFSESTAVERPRWPHADGHIPGIVGGQRQRACPAPTADA